MRHFAKHRPRQARPSRISAKPQRFADFREGRACRGRNREGLASASCVQAVGRHEFINQLSVPFLALTTCYAVLMEEKESYALKSQSEGEGRNGDNSLCSDPARTIPAPPSVRGAEKSPTSGRKVSHKRMVTGFHIGTFRREIRQVKGSWWSGHMGFCLVPRLPHSATRRGGAGTLRAKPNVPYPAHPPCPRISVSSCLRALRVSRPEACTTDAFHPQSRLLSPFKAPWPKLTLPGPIKPPWPKFPPS